MKNYKQLSEVIKQLTLLTQFGIELVTPLLGCLAISYVLVAKLGIGGWIFIPGFFFGLGGSWAVALKLYKSTLHQQEKERKEKKQELNFNRHE